MKTLFTRTAIWMSAGFLVSLGWGFYFANANKETPIGPIVHTLARLTQPSAAVILYLNPAASFGLTWVAFANAATYALCGLTAGMIRRPSLHSSN
jgi:hypothetical protein